MECGLRELRNEEVEISEVFGISEEIGTSDEIGMRVVVGISKDKC